MLENWLCYCILPMAAGFVLDLIFGDPRRITHPVVFMGKMISALERRLLPEDKAKDAGSAGKVRDPEKNGETGGTGESEAGGKAAESGTTERRRQFLAGCITALSVAAVSTAVPAALTAVCAAIHPVFGTAAACVLCWQMLAAKSLKRESMKAYDAFRRGETEEARYAVSMIVGRDVSVLDEEGIVRAAVETVAENTSDGVIAPMFYMALGGPAGAWLYKSVNTMDSMIGYRSERYEFFGKCAARADDVLNFIPARISGILMIAAAALTGLDAADAFRIFRRDRKKHASPNSAQTESACAGALGIRLAGPAVYFGVRHEKPYLGDPLRRPEYEDIRRANRLMYAASVLGIFAVTLAAGAAAGIAAKAAAALAAVF